MIETILENIFIMSLLGSVLTFVLLAIKPVTRKYFEPAWQYYVWAFVLIVMALPLSNASLVLGKNLGIFDLEIANVSTSVLTERAEEIVRSIIIPNTTLIETQNSDVPTAAESTRNVAISMVLGVIWAIGVFVSLTRKLYDYAKFRTAIIRHSYQIEGPEEYFGDFDLPAELEVRKTTLLDAPLLIGLFKSELYLPVGTDSADIALILRHELVHYKRHDLWFKWSAMVVLSLHWFNPVSGIIRRELEEECEILCDFEATRDLEASEKIRYMNLILNMISNANSSSPVLTTRMSGSGKKLKRRFEMIKETKETSRNRRTISIMVASVLLIATVFAGAVLAESIGPDDDQVTFEWKWPVPSSQEISQKKHVITHPATGEEIIHNGIDIKAETGEDVVSAIKGKVVSAEYDRVYGNCVIIAIDMNETEIETFYGHLSEICCEVGDEVMPGDVIGKIGSTGASTGPHLHFQVVIDGEYVDPLSYYPIEI